MTLAFFAVRARLRASDHARNHPELREYGLKVSPDHPSPSGGDAPSIPNRISTTHSCRSGDAAGANPATREPWEDELPCPARCESEVAPSLAHGRVMGTEGDVRWQTWTQASRKAMRLSHSRSETQADPRSVPYSLDPHRALAWWARHGGDAA